jgi:recombination protein RecA
MFGKGISREGDLLDLAANANIIAKTGAWYAYKGNKIGQGRENAKQYLLENPDVYEEVEKIVRDHYFAAAEEQSSESAPAKGAASKASDKEE